MKILDFGCGEGNLAVKLSKIRQVKPLIYIGIDIDVKAVKKARLRIRNPSFEFVVGDGARLPFRSNIFDIVYVSMVLHHMDNYVNGISEIARVLRDGGILILYEAVDNDPFFAFMRRIVKKWCGVEIKSFFTSSRLVNDLNKHFNIIALQYYWWNLLTQVLVYIERHYGIKMKLLKLMSNKVDYLMRIIRSKNDYMNRLATIVRIVAKKKYDIVSN